MTQLPRKTCRDCNLTKSLAVFSRNHKARDGYEATCNECTRKRVAKNRREQTGIPVGERVQLERKKTAYKGWRWKRVPL